MSALIGITGRRKFATIMDAPIGFADAPVDVYMADYAISVADAGGLPVHLQQESDAAALVERLDAVIIAGGDDVDPARYNSAPDTHSTPIDGARDAFEVALIEAAIARGIPVLGICRGNQLLNVARGGSLIQHLPATGRHDHGGTTAERAELVHDVRFTAGSTLAGIYGAERRVNSFHHQAVDRVGSGLSITATAPDGVIEGVELEGGRVVGVQWHPEVLGKDPIFAWLVALANQLAAERVATADLTLAS